MVRSRLKLIDKYLRKRVAGKGAIVFIVSLSIAFIFWLLLVLDEQYTASFPYHLQIVNIPDNKVLRYPLPENTNMKIEAKGWDILKLRRAKSSIPLSVDLDDHEGQSTVMLNSLKDLIGSRELSKMYVKEISPDRVNVLLDDYMESRLPVVPRLKIKYARQYGRSGSMIINPFYAQAYGPASVLSRIDTLYTEERILEDVDADVEIKMKITGLEHNNIQLDISEVLVKLDVEQMTEASQSVRINIKPDNDLPIKIIPDQVNVVYQVPLSKYDLIDSAYFDVFVDTREINIEENRLKLYLETKSEYIYFPRMSTGYVNFIYNE